MISIFHKEATGVEFHSSSHKATFCFMVNIIITNRDFPEVVFKKKTVILDSQIKENISQGNYYRRTRLVTCITSKTRLVTHSTRLITRIIIVLVFPPVVLVYPLVVLVCPFVCPFVVLVCPLVVLVCSLVVLVVLSVGLFITGLYKQAIQLCVCDLDVLL